MTVNYKLFKILSGHDVANGRTDRQTDGRTDGRTNERHTIIRPKFHFGHIKMKENILIPSELLAWTGMAQNHGTVSVSSCRNRGSGCFTIYVPSGR